MEKVAQVLRQVREQRGLSLEEAATRARLSPTYLALLEEQSPPGKRQEMFLSDPLYLIPHLRSYADFLGLDPNFAVAQFTEELQAAQEKSRKKTTTAQSAQLLTSSPHRSRAVSISIILASVLVTLAFIGQYTDVRGRAPTPAPPPSPLAPTESFSGSLSQPLPPPQATTSQAPEGPQGGASSPVMTSQPAPPAATETVQSPAPQPDSTSSSPAAPAQLAKSPVSTSPQPEADPSLTTVLAQQAAHTSSHLLRIQAKETTWIRIFAEGQTKEMILHPGQSAAWNSENAFELTVGNAGGVMLNLDGQELPPLGRSGQVIRNMHLPFPPAEGQG